jgi:hypothetical protein
VRLFRLRGCEATLGHARPRSSAAPTGERGSIAHCPRGAIGCHTEGRSTYLPSSPKRRLCSIAPIRGVQLCSWGQIIGVLSLETIPRATQSSPASAERRARSTEHEARGTGTGHGPRLYPVLCKIADRKCEIYTVDDGIPTLAPHTATSCHASITDRPEQIMNARVLRHPPVVSRVGHPTCLYSTETAQMQPPLDSSQEG